MAGAVIKARSAVFRAHWSIVIAFSFNLRILLANLLQRSRSTFSCVSFPSFFAFKEGMWDTQIWHLWVRQQYPYVFWLSSQALIKKGNTAWRNKFLRFLGEACISNKAILSSVQNFVMTIGQPNRSDKGGERVSSTLLASEINGSGTERLDC